MYVVRCVCCAAGKWSLCVRLHELPGQDHKRPCRSRCSNDGSLLYGVSSLSMLSTAFSPGFQRNRSTDFPCVIGDCCSLKTWWICCFCFNSELSFFLCLYLLLSPLLSVTLSPLSFSVCLSLPLSVPPSYCLSAGTQLSVGLSRDPLVCLSLSFALPLPLLSPHSN